MNDISQISEFGFIVWKLLSAIYKSEWDKLVANQNNKSFRQCVSAQPNKKPNKNNIPNNEPKGKDKQANVSKIPSSISFRLSKSIVAKFKIFKKNQVTTLTNKPIYMQTSTSNVKNIIKIKDVFLKLFTDKVLKIYKVLNKLD